LPEGDEHQEDLIVTREEIAAKSVNINQGCMSWEYLRPGVAVSGKPDCLPLFFSPLNQILHTHDSPCNKRLVLYTIAPITKRQTRDMPHRLPIRFQDFSMQLLLLRKSVPLTQQTWGWAGDQTNLWT
jgi:hypothetical protein